MLKNTPAETLNRLENQKEDIDIWFSKNSMKWRLRKEQLGLFSTETLSEAVCEATIVENSWHTASFQKQTPK